MSLFMSALLRQDNFFFYGGRTVGFMVFDGGDGENDNGVNGCGDSDSNHDEGEEYCDN